MQVFTSACRSFHFLQFLSMMVRVQKVPQILPSVEVLLRYVGIDMVSIPLEFSQLLTGFSQAMQG